MTPDQHRQRHVELHKAMDELFTDFIRCNPQIHNYTQQPILALIEWSYRQTIQPDNVSMVTLQNEASPQEGKP